MTRSGDALHPLVGGPSKSCTVFSRPAGVTLNMPPQPMLPPFTVVPYRFPFLSITKVAAGSWPLPPHVKSCSRVSVPLGASLKTVPQLLQAPPPVVPYRLPAPSRITPPTG